MGRAFWSRRSAGRCKVKKLVLILAVLFLSACAKMEATEFGILFRKLPPSLGGGVGTSVIDRGQTVFLMPWDTVYRFDTRVREIQWGGARGDGSLERSDYVHTRAYDGNEVALAVRIQYSITTDPQKLVRMIQEVATNQEEIESIITAVGRSDIRAYMNELHTAQFFDNKQKFEAGEKVKRAMQTRLEPWGIDIQSVNLGEHRFERVLRDGTVDASYQDKINEVQTLDEKTKRERLRKSTVEADKEREYNDVQAEVNRQIAEADGYKNQAKLKGDGYFEARSNEAKAIFAAGKAEVDGLVEQIDALSGPGGAAILKLELAKNLKESNPKFVVMGSGGGNQSLEVRKVDANDLLSQMGLIEGLKSDEKKIPVSNDVAPLEGDSSTKRRN